MDNNNTKKATGYKNSPLYDPTNAHKFNSTDAEKVFEGQDNTWIVLGRDRLGGFDSGYGGMGQPKAGAIDIVAGRLSALDATMNIGPVNSNVGADASRIYLSQKSDIDNNFSIPDGTTGASIGLSAAVVKADAVRIIARDSLKLVTKTDSKLSNGEEAYRAHGVQLIVDDGGVTNMQPIPKGDNLVAALNELVSFIDELNGQVTTFLKTQQAFNDAISTHTHYENYWAQQTSIDPKLLITQKQTALKQFLLPEQGLKFNINNLRSWKSKYTTATNSKYINSSYHYLN
jgi:hypothetical protein